MATADHISDIYLAVVSLGDKGETVVQINNHHGQVTPAEKVMFGPNQPVSVVLVLEIKKKFYWRRPRYQSKALTIETLASPIPYPIAPGLSIPIVIGKPAPAALMTWYRIVPFFEHPDGLCNDPLRKTDKYYTNVYADSYDDKHREGDFLGGAGNFGKVPGSGGMDIIVYDHQPIGPARSDTWEISADTKPGTYRYAVSLCYTPPGAKEEKELHTRGCPVEPGKKMTRLEEISHLRAADYGGGKGGGISRKVTRVLRKGARPEPYLAVLEVFNNIPWIYGSNGEQTEHQTERLIGFDCADLLIGVARLAGLTKCNYGYADLLARSGHDSNHKRTTTPRVTRAIRVCVSNKAALEAGEDVPALPVPVGVGLPPPPVPPLIYVDDRSEVHLKFGVDIFEGDLIFCDWQYNGKKYDHSTIIWKANGSELSLNTTIRCAHWQPGSSMGEETLAEMSNYYWIRICHW